MIRTKWMFLLFAVVFANFGAITQAQFGGQAYLVGPTVNPSSTVYQGEEHIAIDPNNPNFLVAVVSDGSNFLGTTGQRRGLTKYAVSLDNGATWRDSFVPLNGDGLPVTGDGYAWDLMGDPVVSIDKL